MLGGLGAGGSAQARLRLMVGGNAQGALRTLDSVEGRMGVLKSKINAVSRAAAGLGVAAGVAYGAMIKKAADFESKVVEVHTIMGDTSTSVDELKTLLMDLDIPLGLEERASGLYQTISSGIRDIGEAEEFMEAASKAAVAGHAELGVVIKTGAKTLNNYRDSVEDYNDLFGSLLATVDAGIVKMPELAQAFPRIGASARVAGLEVKDVLAVFSALTTATGSARQAATRLDRVISSIAQPTDQAKEKFEELGVTYGDTAFEGQNLREKIMEIWDAAEGSGEALGEMFPSIRAFQGLAVSAAEGGQMMADNFKIIAERSDDLQKKFDEVHETAVVQWQELTANVEELAVKVGSEALPAVNRYLSLANEWSSSNEDVAKSIESSLQIALGIGLVGASAQAVIGIESLVAAITTLGPGGVAVGLAVAGIGRIGAEWMKTKLDIEATLADMQKQIDKSFQGLTSHVVESFEEMRDTLPTEDLRAKIDEVIEALEEEDINAANEAFKDFASTARDTGAVTEESLEKATEKMNILRSAANMANEEVANARKNITIWSSLKDEVRSVAQWMGKVATSVVPQSLLDAHRAMQPHASEPGGGLMGLSSEFRTQYGLAPYSPPEQYREFSGVLSEFSSELSKAQQREAGLTDQERTLARTVNRSWDIMSNFMRTMEGWPGLDPEEELPRTVDSVERLITSIETLGRAERISGEQADALIQKLMPLRDTIRDMAEESQKFKLTTPMPSGVLTGPQPPGQEGPSTGLYMNAPYDMIRMEREPIDMGTPGGLSLRRAVPSARDQLFGGPFAGRNPVWGGLPNTRAPQSSVDPNQIGVEFRQELSGSNLINKQSIVGNFKDAAKTAAEEGSREMEEEMDSSIVRIGDAVDRTLSRSITSALMEGEMSWDSFVDSIERTVIEVTIEQAITSSGVGGLVGGFLGSVWDTVSSWFDNPVNDAAAVKEGQRFARFYRQGMEREIDRKDPTRTDVSNTEIYQTNNIEIQQTTNTPHQTARLVSREVRRNRW